VLNIANKDHRLVRYLLGELSVEERESIEEQYFQNDNLFRELQVIESDLIDDYVNGELSAEERRKFEFQFLSTPQGRRKVELSRTLLSSVLATAGKSVETRRKENPSWWQTFWRRTRGQSRAWQFSFATLILFLAIGGPWLVVDNMRLRSRLGVAQSSTHQNELELQRLQAQLAAAQQRQQQEEAAWYAHRQQLNEALQQERTERENAEALARQKESQLQQTLRQGGTTEREPPTAIATYVFPYNPVRSPGEKGPPLVISAGQKTVQLQIDLGRTSYPGYRVSLQTVEGTEMWGTVIRKARHTKAGNSITVRLPATIFTRQNYILSVTPSPANGQTESIADYSFRVVRKD
jgi:hypothetical protein